MDALARSKEAGLEQSDKTTSRGKNSLRPARTSTAKMGTDAPDATPGDYNTLAVPTGIYGLDAEAFANASLATAPGRQNQTSAQGSVHIVESGETLWSICGYHYSDPYTWPKLWAKNPKSQTPTGYFPATKFKSVTGKAGHPLKVTNPSRPTVKDPWTAIRSPSGKWDSSNQKIFVMRAPSKDPRKRKLC